MAHGSQYFENRSCYTFAHHHKVPEGGREKTVRDRGRHLHRHGASRLDVAEAGTPSAQQPHSRLARVPCTQSTCVQYMHKDIQSARESALAQSGPRQLEAGEEGFLAIEKEGRPYWYDPEPDWSPNWYDHWVPPSSPAPPSSPMGSSPPPPAQEATKAVESQPRLVDTETMLQHRLTHPLDSVRYNYDSYGAYDATLLREVSWNVSHNLSQVSRIEYRSKPLGLDNDAASIERIFVTGPIGGGTGGVGGFGAREPALHANLDAWSSLSTVANLIDHQHMVDQGRPAPPAAPPRAVPADGGASLSGGSEVTDEPFFAQWLETWQVRHPFLRAFDLLTLLPFLAPWLASCIVPCFNSSRPLCRTGSNSGGCSPLIGRSSTCALERSHCISVAGLASSGLS